MTTDLYIVWNDAKNEGVVFLDPIDASEAAKAADEDDFESPCSTLGQSFVEIYGDGPRSIETISGATRDVIAERRRQIEVEGWTPEYDDEHDGEEMASAAAVYACPPFFRDFLDANDVILWPWERDQFKPSDRRRDLIKAAALILHEIERLDRAAAGPKLEEVDHG